MSIRNFINICEKYSSENSYLLHSMRSPNFDVHEYWEQIAEWLDDNGYMDYIGNLLGEEKDYTTLTYETNPYELWDMLPDELKDKCENGVLETLTDYDPENAPTNTHMDLKNDAVIGNGTWLVHFCKHGKDIRDHGFKFGVNNINKLGLTRWMHDDYKDSGGYNFAFIANSDDANTHAGHACNGGKFSYGGQAVLFQNSGVHVWHNGDSENQIIFWGKDVDPRSIILLTNDGDKWFVNARSGKREFLFRGSFEDCVKWSINNCHQYRNAL